MKKITFSTLSIFIYFTILAGLTACSDNDSDTKQSDTTDLLEICTKWGYPPAVIEELMDKLDYEQLSNTGDYSSWKSTTNQAKVVSFQYNNGVLGESLMVIPEKTTSFEEIAAPFALYEYLGVMDNQSIYIKKDNSVMVCIGTNTKDGVEYYTVGFSKPN